MSEVEAFVGVMFALAMLYVLWTIWYLYLHNYLVERGILRYNRPIRFSQSRGPLILNNIDTNVTIVLTKENVDLIKSGFYSEMSTIAAKDVPADEFSSRRQNGCSICLEEFNNDDEIRILDVCNHVFHKICVDTWMTERSTKCPNCRLDTRIALHIPIEPAEHQEGLTNENEVDSTNQDISPESTRDSSANEPIELNTLTDVKSHDESLNNLNQNVDESSSDHHVVNVSPNQEESSSTSAGILNTTN
ncbi:hypothetical protein HK096_010172 [Nowakowskiella sp. JEL0078]|nr:hypothetical protein HK096_010172 [Nowakowskiella sp. JEL0078]